MEGWRELQAELEHRLLVLVDHLRARIGCVAAELGLTPQQAVLLRYLDQPRTMGELATVLACDRSNVTGLVDRLAARGLVERVSDPRDRRVKHLLLTDEGKAYRDALQERFLAESPISRDLEPGERQQLLTLLRKLTADPGAPDASFPACGESSLLRAQTRAGTEMTPTE